MGVFCIYFFNSFFSPAERNAIPAGTEQMTGYYYNNKIYGEHTSPSTCTHKGPLLKRIRNADKLISVFSTQKVSYISDQHIAIHSQQTYLPSNSQPV